MLSRLEEGVIKPSAPHVLLTGPTAAGKTSLISTIEQVVKAEWKKEFYTVTIESCQRAVCPPNEMHSGYYYDSTGALVLVNRESLALLARAEFIRRCRDALSKAVIAEFGQPDPLRYFIDNLPDFLRGALVLHITAPLTVRASRNASRGELRMPDEVLEWIEEHLDAGASHDLQAIGGHIIEINSTVPKDILINRVDEEVRKWISTFLEQ